MGLIERIMQLLGKIFGWEEPAPTPPPTPPPTPTPTPENPKPPETLKWDTPKQAWHSVRVLCDEAGLTYEQKNLLCAVIYQESAFSNKAVNHNRDTTGRILSTDHGIAQINTYWHIGPNKTFPSVEYVLNNPDKVIQWMIRQYRAGRLYMWVAFSSGAYKKWLSKTSKMWALAS